MQIFINRTYTLQSQSTLEMKALHILCFLKIFFARSLAYTQLVNNNTVTVSSSTYYDYDASRAVDGNFDQNITNCSHTDDICYYGDHAWLRIDLKKEYSIKSVKIWYRADRDDPYYNTQRLKGYSIRVSSDAIKTPSGSTCFKDQNNNELATISEAPCEGLGQFIWIYQSEISKYGEKCPILEICEVQVFGCEKGHYGENCSNNCNHCMNNATCGIRSGQCDDLGCAQGYVANDKSLFCESCRSGFYGADCLLACGHCFGPDTCYHVNGSCLGGCQAGFTGDKCNTSCKPGFYGAECALTCGNCLESKPCNHVNGRCPRGCQEGYKGEKCDAICGPGFYGADCALTCAHCLGFKPCPNINGTCPRGCQEGFTGEMCTNSCSSGFYGKDCSLKCGHCLESGPCNYANGSCPRGCLEGYIGDRCSTYRFGMDEVNDSLQSFTIIILILCPFVGLLVILLCVLTLVYQSRQRKRKLEREDQSKCQDTEEQDQEDEESGQSLAGNVLYTTVQRRSKTIKTTDLLPVIESLENNTDKGFCEEYHSFPYGEELNCTVGKRPENIPKNRFKTTFPYDHSRVVLQSSTNGDYINANFIKNTNGDTAYIASQGPIPETVGDFWQMVWQENVFVIAMVTNLKEGDTKKCERYWPLTEENEMLLDTFTIKLFSERIYAYFEIHHLKLINKKTHGIRLITHLQYTSWPDHGTPNPVELLEYYSYVSRAMEQNPKHKLLVHCSAGIGRTGTLIAMDALHRQGVEKGKINIKEYVHTMRRDRMNMIQNLNQYKVLYYTLYESFRTGSHAMSKQIFVQEVDNQKQWDKDSDLPTFQIEYHDLESLKRTFDESEKQIAIQNSHLNMTENVLPADNMRIILSSYIPGRGTYYNAVPISTFTTKDCIIAGQYPVQGAGVDLIRLLVDQDCSSLVLTHPLSELSYSEEWFSDSLLNYRVEVKPSSKLTACVNKSTVKIKKQSNKSWHKILIYEITTWNKNPPQVLLDTIRCVGLGEHVDHENKLVVLSRDGASRCGEFCAVFNAIQQLQQDQEVDMFTIVRQLQSRRPEMISHVNEYLLCCQTVADFIKSEQEDTYQNFLCKEEGNVYANT